MHFKVSWRLAWILSTHASRCWGHKHKNIYGWWSWHFLMLISYELIIFLLWHYLLSMLLCGELFFFFFLRQYLYGFQACFEWRDQMQVTRIVWFSGMFWVKRPNGGYQDCRRYDRPLRENLSVTLAYEQKLGQDKCFWRTVGSAGNFMQTIQSRCLCRQ